MRTRIDKQNIVDTLILNSGIEMDPKFKLQLKNKLVNKFNNKNKIMNKPLIAGLSFLTLVAMSLFVYSSFFAMPKTQNVEYDKVVAKVQQTDNNQGDSAMKIAIDEYDSISTASEKLAFTPLKPYQLYGAQLSSVQNSRTFDGTKSDSMYLTFAKENDYLFKVLQMKQNSSDFFVPEDSQEISVIVNGNTVKAYYVEYSVNDIDPNSEMALGGDISPASSSLSFNLNGIFFDISQFGDLSKEQLLEIARSIK